MKIQFPEKLIIADLNINSIRNKFDSLSFMIKSNVDILLSYEPSWMIYSHQVSLNRDSMGGEVLLYIRDDIPKKLLKHDFRINIKNLSVEINLRKIRWP